MTSLTRYTCTLKACNCVDHCEGVNTNYLFQVLNNDFFGLSNKQESQVKQGEQK